MQTSIDQTKWYDRIWASLIFFTRLPFWRLHQPPKECYQSVVEHWPLVGWLTGGVMAATLYFSSMVLPYTVAVILAIAARLLLTGALHEDGLADFFDGFGGGGNDRQRILDIMKDSHIGTYGVLGLILYLTTGISLAIQGLLPMGTFIWLTGIAWETVIFLPCLVMYFLYLLMWRKIHGYTGDCCGAAFLLVELAVYLVVCVQYHLLTI